MGPARAEREKFSYLGLVAARCERTLVIQDARVVRDGEWSGAPEFCKRFARPPP